MVSIPVQLFVYNINWGQTEEQLKLQLTKAGIGKSVFIPISIQQRRKFAFVTMENEDIAKLVVEMFSERRITMRIIKVIIPIIVLQWRIYTNLHLLKAQTLCLLKEFFCRISRLKIKQQFYFNNYSISTKNMMFSTFSDIQYRNVILFLSIKTSGLLNNIENVLQQQLKVEQINENIPQFQYLSLQLVLIYFYIMKYQYISDYIMGNCIQIIIQNINSIIQIIKYNKNNQYGLDKPCEDEKLEKLIQYATKTMQVLLQTLNQELNDNYYNIINTKNTLDSISQIIHINFPNQTQCPLRITIRETPILQELQNAAYETLTSLFFDSKCHLEEIQLVLHIIPTLINLSLTCLNKQAQCIDQCQSSPQNHQIISFILDFIFKQLQIHPNYHIQIVDQQLISAIIKLCIFQQSGNHINNINYYAQNIRSQSQQCLRKIIDYCDEELYMQISHSNYTVMLILIVSRGGGYESENDKYEIVNSLSYLKLYIQLLYQGKTSPIITPPQLALAKLSGEQLEQEGGHEEIEFYFATEAGYEVQHRVQNLKKTISNIFLDQTN